MSACASLRRLVFPVAPKNIRALHSPQEYYQFITDRIKTSERSFLSALYLGDGPLEKELLHVCATSKGRISFILDFFRGSRRGKGHSSLDLLRDLKATDPRRIGAAFFRMPVGSERLRSILPEKLNEVFGLYHAKLGIFDDTVVLTGANLSGEYFSNRQDRYIVIENEPEFSSYCRGIMHEMSSMSFQLGSDGLLRAPELGSLITDRPKCAHRLQDFLATFPQRDYVVDDEAQRSLAFIVPSVQVGPWDLNQEDDTPREIARLLRGNYHIDLASAYFNPTNAIQQALLSPHSVPHPHHPLSLRREHPEETTDVRIKDTGLRTKETNSVGTIRVLSAAPTANGFYGAKGLPG
eukprot:Rmarinus@m.4932